MKAFHLSNISNIIRYVSEFQGFRVSHLRQGFGGRSRYQALPAEAFFGHLNLNLNLNLNNY